MSSQPIASGRDFSPECLQSVWLQDTGISAVSSRDEVALKLLLVAVFLPEGLSFFIGDYRLSVARALLICLSITAGVRLSKRVGTTAYVRVPSDIFAPMAGAWMVIAAIVTSGVAQGLKGGGALALEFAGSYYVFRFYLGSIKAGYRGVREPLQTFLLSVGRNRFVVPLYTELLKNPDDKAWAKTVYARAREHYHPLTQAAVDKQFAKK